MTMHSNRLKSATRRVAAWRRVLSDRWALIFNACLRPGDAFGAGGLPVSFVLRRGSRCESKDVRRHFPMPDSPVNRIARAPSVHAPEHRADARSILRPNADRRNNHRAA
jgi:hypothetical protein